MKKILVFMLALLIGLPCFAAGLAAGSAFGSGDEEKKIWERSPDDTPLESAVKEGDIARVEELIAQGVMVDELHKGVTPLGLASVLEYGNIVKVLIHKGHANVDLKFDNGRTALIQAVFCGKTEIVNILIDEGHADVNAQMDGGFTALMWASYRGYVAIVKKLIEAKADVNLSTDQGSFTALSLAQEAGNKDVIKLLKENGATK